MRVWFKGLSGHIDLEDHDIKSVERADGEWVLKYEDGKWGMISGYKVNADYYELVKIEEE